MQHEAVFVVARQCVDALRVTLGAQRGHHQRLGFATREQGRTVGARQHAVADLDRTHGAGVAAVDARLAGQDLAAHDFGFDVEQHALDSHAVKRRAVGLQGGHHFGGHHAASLGAGLLGADLVRGLQLGSSQFVDTGDQRLVLGRRLPGPDRLAGVTHQFVDRIDRDVALLVAKHHGAQHDLFGQLFGFGLDHQHGGFGAGHDQVHLRILELGLARVQHVLSIDPGHTCGADRAIEWNAGNRQRGAGGDQGGNVAFDFRVQRQHMNHHLHFVEEAFRKQRADRAVDQARGQGLEFAGAAFTLEEAAGNAAGRIGFLEIVDGQREKVLAGFGVGLGNHGGQHHGAIHVDDDSAAGLARDFAGLHRDLVLAPLEGLGDFVENAHVFLH